EGPGMSSLADMGRGTLGPGVTALIDAVSPKLGDTPWTKALGLNTYNGPRSTAWTKALGLDTYEGPGMSSLADMGRGTLGPGVTALIDAVSPKLGDTPWTKALGLNTYDGPRSTYWAKALGLDSYGGSISSFVDAAALHTIEDRIGRPWIKHLGGGCAHGSLLDDVLSPTSFLEEEVPLVLETVDVAELSVGVVEMDPPTVVYDGSNLHEMTWSWDTRDSVAVLVSVIFMPMVVLFHMQGLDWALPAVEFVAALLLALILRDRR
ncbi:hypothetical protein, partial [Mycolicibacterium arenosum]